MNEAGDISFTPGEDTLPAPDFDERGLFARLQEATALLNSLTDLPKNPALLLAGGAGHPVRAWREIGSGISVGRDTHCELAVPEDATLSRRHFRIVCQDGRHFLRDCGSGNGTAVAGRRGKITEHELRDGDVILAGDSRFVFVLGEGEEAAAS